MLKLFIPMITTSEQSFKPAHKPSTEKRTVVRFRNAERFESQAYPTPFTAARAREIIATGDTFAVMSDGELAYADAVWETIPNDKSCFMTALNVIAQGEFPE